MPSFTLVDIEVILSIHEEQLATHGGSVGLRDRGLLESALARPENKMAYEPDADSAAYAYGIARNHLFVDGNKRTAFVAMELFLLLNGFNLLANDEDAAIAMLRLASGDIDEQAFAKWLRDHIASV